MVARQLHVYENLTGEERRRLVLAESNKGGGWQAAMYQLRFHVVGEKLEVPDALYQTLKRYVEKHGSEGGWQGRIPQAMMDEILDQAPQPRQDGLL